MSTKFSEIAMKDNGGETIFKIKRLRDFQNYHKS